MFTKEAVGQAIILFIVLVLFYYLYINPIVPNIKSIAASADKINKLIP